MSPLGGGQRYSSTIFPAIEAEEEDGPKISGLSSPSTYNVEDFCDGCMGDPTHSSAETGEKILENWSDSLLELLKQYDAL
jgi:creatinine amidohydrolase/Fe(II)-dependent formamide hydrolase-like protein